MRQTQQIQMSQRAEWSNLDLQKLRHDLSIDDIPTSAFKTVYHILNQSAIFLKERRAKLRTVAFCYVDPLAPWVNFWSFVVIFVAYFLQFQISLTLGFGPQFWSNEIEKTVYHTAYICLLFMLGCDIFINFHKGYYAFGSGKIIQDRILIIKRYVRSHFIPELLTIGLLIIPLFLNTYTLNFLQILTIILLAIKKFKCQAQITRSLEYRRTLRIVFTLAMLGCDVMLLGNFGACVFLGLDLLLWRLQFFGNDPQYYWLSNDSSYSVDLMDGPWIQQYVFAQLYSTGTLSTLAPGPFGKNPIQITYEIFLMTFFMILASYVGEVLVSILYGNWQVRIFHENNIQKFDNFMSLKGVVQSIKIRIHNFFELIWQFQVKNDTEGQQKIIEKLPLSLKQDLVSQLGFSSELKFVEYFDNFQDLQKTVAFKIRSMIVDPDATLFEIGSPLDTVGQGYIIFIKNGLAQFYFPFGEKKNIICLSNSQKLLGQYQFVTGLSHSFNCKSIDLSVIEKISYSDFHSIIKNFNLSQQFHTLKCKLAYYKQLSLVGRTCLICDRYHRENQCMELMVHCEVVEGLTGDGIGDGDGDRLYKKVREGRERRGRVREYKGGRGTLGKVREIKWYEQFVERMGKSVRRCEKILQGILILNERHMTNLNTISDQVTNFQQYYPDYNIIP